MDSKSELLTNSITVKLTSNQQLDLQNVKTTETLLHRGVTEWGMSRATQRMKSKTTQRKSLHIV